MPQAQQGNVITSSAQINPEIVESSDIENSTITNEDIAETADIAYSKLALTESIVNEDVAEIAGIAYSKLALTESIVNDDVEPGAAIEMSKLSLAITNAEIAAEAAIADSKLAQITTASKVSGAAITNLASLPAEAGVIPTANLPSAGSKIATATTDVSTGATSDEVTLFTATLPGGTLGTSNAIRIFLKIIEMTSNGTTETLTLRLYLGTTVIAIKSQSVVFSGSTPIGFIEGIILAAGSTTAQEGSIFLQADKNGAVTTNSGRRQQGNGTATENSANDLTIKITAQWQTGGNAEQLTIAHGIAIKYT